MDDENKKYTVEFCNDLTISCSDGEGVLKFGFDLGPKDVPKSIVLLRRAFDASLAEIPETPFNSRRAKDAFAQAIEYLLALGFKVDVVD